MLEDVPNMKIRMGKLRANTSMNVCMTDVSQKFCNTDLVDKELLLPRPNTLGGSQHQKPTFYKPSGKTLQC